MWSQSQTRHPEWGCENGDVGMSIGDVMENDYNGAPSPEEIASRAAEIRAGWSDDVRSKRYRFDQREAVRIDDRAPGGNVEIEGPPEGGGHPSSTTGNCSFRQQT